MANVKIDSAKLAEENAIFKCPNLTTYMKKVNEASLELAKEDFRLIQKKGELFELAKKRVHDTGYAYAKHSSKSKVFGNGSSEASTISTKRKYISTSAREERIDELTESIKSVSETILLLTKQKEQYTNLDKFQQAADVNTSITEKVAEKRKLQKELKALQDAREKSKTYKKKKSFRKISDNSDSRIQKELSWSESNPSNSSERSGESSGADTIILSDNESLPKKQLDDKSYASSNLKKQMDDIFTAYKEVVQDSTEVPHGNTSAENF